MLVEKPQGLQPWMSLPFRIFFTSRELNDEKSEEVSEAFAKQMKTIKQGMPVTVTVVQVWIESDRYIPIARGFLSA